MTSRGYEVIRKNGQNSPRNRETWNTAEIYEPDGSSATLNPLSKSLQVFHIV